MHIELTPAELMMGANTGANRHTQALLRGMKHKYGAPDDIASWDIHIEGACGEIAAAKALGVFWSASVNVFKTQADIGRAIEVRTRSKSHYELIVRPDDKTDSAYVLVTGGAPSFDVRGWLIGEQARREEWWQMHGGRPGAWFVPQAALRPIEELTHV